MSRTVHTTGVHLRTPKRSVTTKAHPVQFMSSDFNCLNHYRVSYLHHPVTYGYNQQKTGMNNGKILRNPAVALKQV